MKKENFILFFLLSLLFIASYFLIFQVIQLKSPIIYLEAINPGINPNITSYPSGKLQFYPNIKFNHNEITYFIDASCNEDKRIRIKEAFKILEEEIEELAFTQVNQDSDINVICDNKKIPSDSKGYFIVGEGGPTPIVNTTLFYIIEGGIVLLYQDKNFCHYPNVEIHELLHVFGFEHSNNKDSIMYQISSCNQIITEDIKEELKRLYSIENLPELYFSDIGVSQKGNYIDFELKIKNSGLINAEGILLKINALPSGEEIDEFNIGEIEYGGGKYLKVENLKIPFKVKEISFFIKSGKELDYENNKVIFDLK